METLNAITFGVPSCCFDEERTFTERRSGPSEKFMANYIFLCFDFHAIGFQQLE